MKINDNTKLKVRIPKNLYESVKKELAKKKLQENEALQAKKTSSIKEDATSLAWIPAAAAGLGIGKLMLQGVVDIMNEKGYKGFNGFIEAWKEFKAEQGDVAKKF